MSVDMVGLTWSSPQSAGLSDFLGSMKRINEALTRLQATKLRSNQETISELGFLLSSGSQQLGTVFDDILREDSRPIEPLFYVTKRRLLHCSWHGRQADRDQRNRFPRSPKKTSLVSP